MYKHIIKFSAMALLLMSFQCEDDDALCDVQEAYLFNDAGIISLNPLQDTYSAGDEITFLVSLPSNNTFFGAQEDLFEATQDQNATLSFSNTDILLENTIEFIKGSQGQDLNSFILNYNEDTDAYELEATISLNRLGAYSQNKQGLINIGESGGCIDYQLFSDILGVQGSALEFIVE